MGREMIKENLEEIRTKKGIQFIVANGENIAHGNGITNNYYKFLLDNHVNIVTLGNHSFANHDVFNFIDAIYVLFVDDRLYFSPIITLLSLLVGLLP